MTKKNNESNIYCDDLECYKITDKIHSHYINIQAADEEEVRKITSKVVGYFMKIGWEDTTLTLNHVSTAIKDTAHNLKEHKPLWNWKHL